MKAGSFVSGMPGCKTGLPVICKVGGSPDRLEMKAQAERQQRDPGILHVVSTPLGNLEDITLRALKVLRGVDLIAAEGVRHTRRLCEHYGIKTRLVRYNQHNRKVRGPELITRLKGGDAIALVTNAGTPGVSDPGVFLVGLALKEGIRVSPVPGPCAVTAALSASGLRGDGFLFQGFLSNRPGKRKRQLKAVVAEPCTLVFFEAPHRLQAMLADLLEILGDREMVLVRELTKIHEEVRRGTVGSILRAFDGQPVRGELTLVVAGKDREEAQPGLDEEVRRRMERLLREARMSLKDVARLVASETGLNYRELYKACLSIKRDIRPS